MDGININFIVELPYGEKVNVNEISSAFAECAAIKLNDDLRKEIDMTPVELEERACSAFNRFWGDYENKHGLHVRRLFEHVWEQIK